MDFHEAPPLPRAPTMTRGEADGARPSPPRFPSMHDVRTARKAKPAPVPLLERVRARVRSMPNPTALFLLLTGVVLLLHTVRPSALRSWLARLLLPPGLALSVAATALWRPTVARFVSEPKEEGADGPPPGVLPDAHALVRRGAALRARDAAVTASEYELRKGQIRLEVLRKEIESRLPSHNSLTPAAPPGDVAPSVDRPTSPLTPRSASNPFLTFAGRRSNSPSPSPVPKSSSFRA